MLPSVGDAGARGYGFRRPPAASVVVSSGRNANGFEGAAAGSHGQLEQQLQDLSHSEYLMAMAPQPCSTGVVESSSCAAGAAGAMGFSVWDLDRSNLFDDDFVDFLPLVDHHENPTSAVAPFCSPMNPLLATAGGLGPPVSSQPQLSSGERRVEAKRGLKRSRDQTVPESAYVRREDLKLDTVRARVSAGDAKINSTQPSTMLRERQRRDDMTHKFAVLETLLPIRVKVMAQFSLP